MKTPPVDRIEAPGDPSGARPSQADRYLWDRSGPPDPFVQKLESLLASSALRSAGEPVVRTGADGRRDRVQGLGRVGRLAAVAASLLVVVGLGSFLLPRASPARPGWAVASVEGGPRADGAALHADGVLPVGAWLETDSRSKANVRVATIGDIDVLPDSRLRITETSDAKHEIELAHGRIRARILAPPRLFFVRTPAALATDMGCRYDLDVPESGPGLLHVTLGWVLMEATARGTAAARVPAGVSCVIDEVGGPGTPFRPGSACETHVRAMDERRWENVTEGDLDSLLDACGRADAVTLWHVLYRVSDARRPMVLERLRLVLGISIEESRAELIALDADAMDRLWSEVMWAR